MSDQSAAQFRLLRATDPRPDADTLVIFQHAGGSAAAFAALAREVDPAWRVAGVDLPGRFGSCTDPPPLGFTELAGRLEDLIATNATGRVALFGHSLGAQLAYAVAWWRQQRQRPAHWLGMSAPRAPLQAFGPARSTAPTASTASHAELCEMLRELGGTPDDVLTHPDIEREVVRVFRSDLRLLESQVVPAAHEVHCPATLFQPDNDAECGLADAQFWASRVCGPTVRQVWPGGHFYLFDAVPEFGGALSTELARDGAGIPVGPASTRQVAMLAATSSSPQPASLNVSRLLRIRGAVDRVALARAVQDLLDRHEVLHSTLQWREGSLWRMAHPDIAAPVEWLPSSRTETEALAELSARTLRPFELTTEPAFRVTVASTSPTQHYLLLLMHHIVTDGWSGDIILRDLDACYRARTGTGCPLPPLKQRFDSYVKIRPPVAENPEHWQAESSFWSRTLGEVAAGGKLADRDPATVSHLATLSCRMVPADITARLTRLAAAHRLTPFALYLTALRWVVRDEFGVADVLVSGPVADRVDLPEETADNLVGFLVNQIPLRNPVPAGHSFWDHASTERDGWLEAFEHSALPYEAILAHLPPGVACELAFTYRDRVPGAPRLGDLDVELLPHGTRFLRQPIFVEVSRDQDGVTINGEYQAERIRTDVFERLLDRYLDLLTSIAGEHDEHVD
ncbi:MAG: condensation domain-containing protein [Jatrophihabitantaceae bacterium]